MEQFIVWDIDGTVVDTRNAVAQAYLAALAAVGIEEMDGTRIFPFVGRKSTLVFSEVHGLDGAALMQALDVYATTFETLGLSVCSLYPGMGALLHDLKARGAKMTVASARSSAQLSLLFEQVGIPSMFDAVFATDYHDRPADKPALVRQCIALMGASPAQCVMVGDRCYDLEGGVAAGTRTIGVTFGFGTRDELLACGPSHIVDDVPTLRKLLLGE